MDETQSIQQANHITDTISDELDKLMVNIDSKIDSGRVQYNKMKSMISDNLETWSANREKRMAEEEARRKETDKKAEKRSGKISDLMNNVMHPQGMIREKVNDVRAKISKRRGKKGVPKFGALKGSMSKMMGKMGKSIVGKLLKGVGKVMGSTLAKFFSAAIVLQFLTSPAGLMVVAFISAWFKNTVWIPFLLPVVDGIKASIELFKDAWNNAKVMLDDIVNFWKAFPDTMKSWYEENVKPWFEKIISFITPIANVIFKVVQPMLILYKKMLTGILEGLSRINILPNSIQDKLKELAGEVRSFEIPKVLITDTRTIDTAINNRAANEKINIISRDKKLDDKLQVITKDTEKTQQMVVNQYTTNTEQNVAPTVININDDFKGEPSFNKDTY
jgi:hypothetical protein